MYDHGEYARIEDGEAPDSFSHNADCHSGVANPKPSPIAVSLEIVETKASPLRCHFGYEVVRSTGLVCRSLIPAALRVASGNDQYEASSYLWYPITAEWGCRSATYSGRTSTRSGQMAQGTGAVLLTRLIVSPEYSYM